MGMNKVPQAERVALKDEISKFISKEVKNDILKTVMQRLKVKI